MLIKQLSGTFDTIYDGTALEGGETPIRFVDLMRTNMSFLHICPTSFFVRMVRCLLNHNYYSSPEQ